MKKKTGSKKKKKKAVNEAVIVPVLPVKETKQPAINNSRTMKIFAVAAAALSIVLLLYCVSLMRRLDKSETNVLSLQLQIEGLAKQKELLISQKVEQDKKMTELSDTLNDKLRQEEEIAKSYIPYGFPVKGMASYDSTAVELEGNPIAMFHVTAGTSVMATAVGKVSSVAGGASGYIVTVNHGNGYVTIYRNGARPKVEEGAEVTKETEIFQIEAGKEDLGYQIMENDKYIDPLGFMETYG